MELDLDAIEAAEQAMTPGPWRDGQYARPAFETQVFCDHLEVTVAGCAIEEDATGIAILRNAAPALTRRLREQDAEIARLQDELTRVREQASEALSVMQAELIQSEQACDWLRALVVKIGDAYYSLLYAHAILKAPFPAGEAKIATNPPGYVLAYALDCIKGPFPAGEGTMQGSPIIWKRYQTFVGV